MQAFLHMCRHYTLNPASNCVKSCPAGALFHGVHFFIMPHIFNPPALLSNTQMIKMNAPWKNAAHPFILEGFMVRDMTHGSPIKLIFGFWFPMLLGQLFQQVYNLVDSIIVGRFVGVKAFAGISATGSLNFMILGFLLGLCSGCAIPVAQAFGENDPHKMRKFFANAIYLCGGNRRAARLCGLNPKKLSYVLYINSAFLASVSGIIYVARVKTALPTALTSFQFTGVTAAILGGVAFGGGSGNMLGCTLGMLILSIFNNGVSTVGFNANYTKVFNGVLLIVGLALDAITARRNARKVVSMSLAASQSGKKEEG